MERHTEEQVAALKKLREGTYTAEELESFREAFAKNKSACILFDKRYNSGRVLQINLLCELMDSIPDAKFLQVDYCSIEDKEVIEADVGIGPDDAAINAVNKGIKNFADIKPEEYHVDAVTGGTDALIEVIVKLSSGDKIISARATEPDIINASVEAYIDGVNRLLENKHFSLDKKQTRKNKKN